MCSTLAIFPIFRFAGEKDDGVVAAVGRLAHDVVERVDEIEVVAAVARHVVGAAAPVEDVVAVVADQGVGVAAADAGLDEVVARVRVVAGVDRDVVVVAVDAGELPGAEVEDGARGRAGEVDRVVAAGVMDHETDVVLHPRGGQEIAVHGAAEAVDGVAGIQVDVLVGAHALFVDRREEAADDRFDIGEERRHRGPAAGLADVDPVEIGHDGVLLAIVGPGGVVEVVDLHAAGAAVVVETGVVQAELVAEFVDEGVEDVAADIGLVRLGVVEALADADIAIGRIGAAIVPALVAHFGADDLHPVRLEVEGGVVDDLELQRRDGRPHRQGTDRGGLVLGVVVEIRDVDPERARGGLRRQAAVQRPEIVEKGAVVLALAVGIIRRLVVHPPRVTGGTGHCWGPLSRRRAQRQQLGLRHRVQFRGAKAGAPRSSEAQGAGRPTFCPT